jgi:hypothetical protein
MKIIGSILALGVLLFLVFTSWSTSMVTGMANLTQAQANLEVAQAVQLQAKALYYSQCLTGVLVVFIFGLFFLVAFGLVYRHARNNDYTHITPRTQLVLPPESHAIHASPTAQVYPEAEEAALYLLEHWN